MSVLEQAIGWLAPPQCVACGREGSALCISCLTTEILPFGGRCWRCGALSPLARGCSSCRSVGGPRAVWISTNYESTAQQLVRLYKFGQLRAAARPLAKIMAATFADFHQSTDIKMPDYIIVPVPTATGRSRQRGFDHAALLAKSICRNLGLPYSVALGRLGQERQLGAPRSQRLAQPAGNYFVKRPTEIASRDILLIDDVITTGGTIIECAKTLRAAGARHVDALVFAKKL